MDDIHKRIFFFRESGLRVLVITTLEIGHVFEELW